MADSTAGGDAYAALVGLSYRQALGGMKLAWHPTKQVPWYVCEPFRRQQSAFLRSPSPLTRSFALVDRHAMRIVTQLIGTS